MRRFGAMLGALALVVVIAAFHPAVATSPGGTVVHNPDGSYTLTATAGGTPAVLDLPELLSQPVPIGQLASLSAHVSYDGGGCAGAFEFDPVDASAFLGLDVALTDPSTPCTSGPTGNLIAGSAHRFDPNRDGGSVLDFAHLTSRYGSKAITAPRFVLDPTTGTVTLTIRDIALQTAGSTSPSVTVALCRTSDGAELSRGADYHAGTASCPASDSRLDPRGILITASAGDVSRYLGAATSTGGLYPPPMLTSGAPVVFGEGLRGTHSAALTGPTQVAITIYVAAAPPIVAATNVNAITGAAIAGQSFELDAASCTGAPLATTVADTSGRVALRPPAPGEYCEATAPAHESGSMDLGNLPSTPRDSTITARFTTAAGATVTHVCAALDEQVAASNGPAPGARCDRDVDGTITWPGIPVGVEASLDVLGAPASFSFGTAPSAAIPADLWSAGVLLVDASAAHAQTGRVVIMTESCDDQLHIGTHIRVTHSRAAVRIDKSCRPVGTSVTIQLYGTPRYNASRAVSTDAHGRAAIALPVTGTGRFPHGRHVIEVNEPPAPVNVAFDVTAGRPTYVIVKSYIVSAGGFIPEANPTPPRASPPRLIVAPVSASSSNANAIAAPVRSTTPRQQPSTSAAESPGAGATVTATSHADGSSDDSGPSAVVIGGIGVAVLLAIAVGVALVVRSGGAHSEG